MAQLTQTFRSNLAHLQGSVNNSRIELIVSDGGGCIGRSWPWLAQCHAASARARRQRSTLPRRWPIIEENRWRKHVPELMFRRRWGHKASVWVKSNQTYNLLSHQGVPLPFVLISAVSEISSLPRGISLKKLGENNFSKKKKCIDYES